MLKAALFALSIPILSLNDTPKLKCEFGWYCHIGQNAEQPSQLWRLKY